MQKGNFFEMVRTRFEKNSLKYKEGEKPMSTEDVLATVFIQRLLKYFYMKKKTLKHVSNTSKLSNCFKPWTLWSFDEHQMVCDFILFFITICSLENFETLPLYRSFLLLREKYYFLLLDQKKLSIRNIIDKKIVLSYLHLILPQPGLGFKLI